MTDLVCPSSESQSRSNQSTVNRIKLKIRDLISDVEELENDGDHSTVVKYLAELLEENKCLNRKCRELAQQVKSLRQERKERLKNFSGRSSNEAGVEPRTFVMIAEYERVNTEMQMKVRCLQDELIDARSQVELLTAQMLIYKEDFELERKDRERAMDKIDILERRMSLDAATCLPLPYRSLNYPDHGDLCTYAVDESSPRSDEHDPGFFLPPELHILTPRGSSGFLDRNCDCSSTDNEDAEPMIDNATKNFKFFEHAKNFKPNACCQHQSSASTPNKNFSPFARHYLAILWVLESLNG